MWWCVLRTRGGSRYYSSVAQGFALWTLAGNSSLLSDLSDDTHTDTYLVSVPLIATVHKRGELRKFELNVTQRNLEHTSLHRRSSDYTKYPK